MPPELEVRQAFLYQRHYDVGGVSVPGHGQDKHFRGRWSLFTSAYTGSSAHLLQMGALNGWELREPAENEQGGGRTEADEGPRDDAARQNLYGEFYRAAGGGEPLPDTEQESEAPVRAPRRGLLGLIRGQRSDSYVVAMKSRSQARQSLLSPPEATERGLVAIVSIVLSARSEGLRRSAMVVGGFSLLMLLLAGLLVIFNEDGERKVPLSLEVLATVLVFAPTVAAAVISQRASHPMTEELTARLRDTVVIFGVLPVMAVVVLAMTDGLGPYQWLSHLASGLVLATLFLLDLLLLGVLWIQRRIERKIEPEPLPPSSYWHPKDAVPYAERKLIPDEEAKRVVQTSLCAQPTETRVVQSVEGLRLPSASFYLVTQKDDDGFDDLDAEHGWLTDGALRRSARKFAESAGLDLT